MRSWADELRPQVAPLLAEPPYRVILDLAEARVLARTGEQAAARDLLQATWGDVPYEDVGYRLAHLEALTGGKSSAVTILLSLMSNASTSRGYYDGPHLLLRVAIERHDERGVLAPSERLAASGAQGTKRGEVSATLLARAHLWWNTVTSADGVIRSQLYAPEGDAIACLARWRLGQSSPDDVRAMQAFIEAVPDAVGEGNAALSAAQLAGGDALAAIVTLDRLISSLSLDAREDFSIRQILDLAEAIRAEALLAAGRPADARAAATELLPRLTPGLLPAILCHEVLDGSVPSAWAPSPRKLERKPEKVPSPRLRGEG